ncbi:hypothetical protein [Streptomyces javensis]|uniref:Uncharacterized protein n=1 Tax=Streptomyces javensis TaxID=114698 RepID=A0ABS0R8R6_9ACTN|nr:hypothetical protein [Streptomyces javensis]MBI0313359.1 hypothetical protein [Streptomyces javensis]
MTIRPTPPWENLDPLTRASLEDQTPARLQRVMYGLGEDYDQIPVGEFTADIARADRWLNELRAKDPEAARIFHGLTFADAAWSGRAEYYLCDALIEWGNAHHDAGVWGLPVIRDLFGKYDKQ